MFPIVSAVADKEHPSYRVQEAFDRQKTISGNGWAYDSNNTPASAAFRIAANSQVGRIEILSGVGTPEYNPTNFHLFYSTDPVPSLSGNWTPLTGLYFVNSVAGGSITDNHVTATGQDIINIGFNATMLTGIKLMINESNAADNNSVITEFEIFHN